MEPKTEPAPPPKTVGNEKLWRILRTLGIIFLIFWGVYFAYLMIDPRHLHPEYRLNVASTLLLSFVQLIKWFVAIAVIYIVIYTQVLKKR